MEVYYGLRWDPSECILLIGESPRGWCGCSCVNIVRTSKTCNSLAYNTNLCSKLLNRIIVGVVCWRYLFGSLGSRPSPSHNL